MPTTTLTAADGHELGAYFAGSATPSASPETATPAVVIVQEIFGVNRHIRSVVDSYAREGFFAIAPALFDRIEPNVELPYDAAGIERGRALATKIGLDHALLDVNAALTHLASLNAKGLSATAPNTNAPNTNAAHTRAATPKPGAHANPQPGPTTPPAGTSASTSASATAARPKAATNAAVIGYCFGGTIAWLAATRLHPAAAVGYYGGRIDEFASEQPHCPVMLHFGGLDKHIGPEKIARIRAAHPEIAVFVYPEAGHGFNCDQRPDFHPPSAALARDRTLTFLRQRLKSVEGS